MQFDIKAKIIPALMTVRMEDGRIADESDRGPEKNGQEPAEWVRDRRAAFTHLSLRDLHPDNHENLRQEYRTYVDKQFPDKADELCRIFDEKIAAYAEEMVELAPGRRQRISKKRTDHFDPFYPDFSHNEANELVQRLLQDINPEPGSLPDLMIKVALSNPDLEIVCVNTIDVNDATKPKEERNNGSSRGAAHLELDLVFLCNNSNIGTFAEEIGGHNALKLLFGNKGLPYPPGDEVAKAEFEQAIQDTMKKAGRGQFLAVLDLAGLNGHNYTEDKYQVEVPAKILQKDAIGELYPEDKRMFSPLIDYMERHVRPRAQEYLAARGQAEEQPPSGINMTASVDVLGGPAIPVIS